MATRRRKVPILTYHGLHTGGLPRNQSHDSFYSIAVEKFESHVAWLHRHAYTSVLASQLRNSDALPEKIVCITFDDGLKSDFRLAYPVLKRYGLCATFFVIVDRVGHEGYATFDELRQMLVAGNSIQCHGLRHEDLTRVAESTLLSDLKLARETLSSRLGKAVNSLALPFGSGTEETARIAMQAGFDLVFSSEQRFATPDDQPLPRFAVHGRTTDTHFKRIVSRDQLLLPGVSVRQKVIAITKLVVGRSRYSALKRLLLS